ncbi:MAG: YbjN domain-containing protein [Proteobacteria bacterium]|nr:YbjN domain-containing protein [Pseudomonadota bacterium]
MNQADEKYVDRETGKVYSDAYALTNAYIARFSDRVSEAIGEKVTFSPLNGDNYAYVVRGSATVGIHVADNQQALSFLAEIMNVPKTDQPNFYRRLLELNYSVTSQGAFSIDKDTDTVYLCASRSIEGLDYQEFEDMLHTVATVADEWDDRLIAEFKED